MKIAICDDESIFREQLKKEIEQYYTSLDILVDCYESGSELLTAYVKRQHDIVFLDIEMVGINGLQVAKALHAINRDLPIVLVTTHTELAPDGYEVQAFRFLAKPINSKKLGEALQAVESRLFAEEKLCITCDGVQRYLSALTVCYLKSENVYVSIVTTGGTYLVRGKLKEQSKQLPPGLFVQIHRSYVVNLGHVISFDGEAVYLEDGVRLPVSRANRETFQLSMLRYMKRKK